MKPSITTVVKHLINVGGAHTWKASDKEVVKQNNVRYVKLNPWLPGFVRLVADGIAEVKMHNPSLTNNSGIALLTKLRNEAQRDALQEAKPKASKLFESPPPAQRQRTLFELSSPATPAVKPAAKRPRAKKAHGAHGVDSLLVTVPGYEYEGVYVEPMPINILPPLRCDDPLCVEMNSDVIAGVVKYVRSTGITVESLGEKRHRHSLSYEERMIPRWKRYQVTKPTSPNSQSEDDAEVDEDAEWWRVDVPVENVD